MTIIPFLNADDASTPLTLEEREGLIPSYITMRNELNEAEHLCIAAAERWALTRKRDVLNESFLLQLHKKMFKDIWKWAGMFRTTPRNIGIEPWNIACMLHLLVQDIQFWLHHKTYPLDEIATRFHHRLVLIHPFPNGNGRHARLSADLLLVSLGQKRFTWGRESIVDAGETRRQYILALRAADQHQLEPLLHFVRS